MNYLKALNYGNNQLKINNINTHSLDSEILLSKILNKTREDILINLEKNILPVELAKYKKLICRRKSNEPVAYIIQNKEFWKSNFFINKDVLIPRPETELVIEEVIKLINHNSSKSILDVGTGSGCIIISLLKERPNCFATAIDKSKKALKVAKYNAKIHHLINKIRFINIDIDKFNLNKYDFILSNPPYINSIDIKRLDKDVRLYEPMVALLAGTDGLSQIRKLVNKSRTLLKKNGKLIFEIGKSQLNEVIRILKKNKFYINEICNDLQSYPRVIVSTKLF
mgnify:CR=1 FL=1